MVRNIIYGKSRELVCGAESVAAYTRKHPHQINIDDEGEADRE